MTDAAEALAVASRQALAVDGPLARLVSAYRPRPAQEEMAAAVAAALENRRHLVAEAGTGTGKTFAYLVPALLSGRRVLVATASKTLQDQLYHKDLPLLRRALGMSHPVALLKGRANYLCPYRLEQALSGSSWVSSAEREALAAVHRWSSGTVSGDIAECTGVPEDSGVWPAVTSTQDNCLGQDCPRIKDCPVVQARRRAMEARVVVVNHHVLCADWGLRDHGFGELLPDVDLVIVDEAHQLADVASQFLGAAVSTRQLQELAHDTLTEQKAGAADMATLAEAAELLPLRAETLRAALGPVQRRGPWRELEAEPRFGTELEALRESLSQLERQLAGAALRSQGLENCHKRSETLLARLDELLGEAGGAWVRWYQTHRRSFSLHRTPLSVADPFHQFLRRQKSVWVFTSATLSVQGQFRHFCDELGLSGVDTRRWDSPFDYRHQALCYIPSGLPEPNSRDYTQAVVEAAVPAIEASGGRTFFLFTSHAALQQAAMLLGRRLSYPLLVQGSQPKQALVREFVEAGNAVLLGAASFWEGVDVRGPALSLVIIDRLPFAPPDDPVAQARIEAVKRRGDNAFLSLQLPAAVIALRQGAGRLIRDADDRGVLMLCDPRLYGKSYGRVFLNSLPAMPVTREIRRVQEFLAYGSGAIMQ